MTMETVEKQKQEQRVEPPKLHKVVFLNDDFTTMDFVFGILMRLFNKNADQAKALTMEIHNRGRGIAGVYPKDIAETKRDRVINEARASGFPLQVRCEPE